MFTKLRFQSRLKKFRNLWFINQYAINVRSRLINIHIELTIISQLFLSVANSLLCSLALMLSIQNFGVYPIFLLCDLCNVDFAVEVAVLTTQYKEVQHKYTKYRRMDEIYCSKTERESTTAPSKFCCKVQNADRTLCCFHYI